LIHCCTRDCQRSWCTKWQHIVN